MTLRCRIAGHFPRPSLWPVTTCLDCGEVCDSAPIGLWFGFRRGVILANAVGLPVLAAALAVWWVLR